MSHREKNFTGEELGRVTLGIPSLASFEIPVRRSMLTRLRHAFRSISVDRLLKMPWGRAHVRVAEVDDGTIDFYLFLVNMTDDPFLVERLSLERLTANGNSLSFGEIPFSPPREPIGGYDISEVYFRVTLTSPAIRLFLRVIQPAANPQSSPGVELIVGGRLEGVHRKKRLWISFTVAIRWPELQVVTT